MSLIRHLILAQGLIINFLDDFVIYNYIYFPIFTLNWFLTIPDLKKVIEYHSLYVGLQSLILSVAVNGVTS